jgi:hypothetical protein
MLTCKKSKNPIIKKGAALIFTASEIEYKTQAAGAPPFLVF